MKRRILQQTRQDTTSSQDVKKLKSLVSDADKAVEIFVNLYIEVQKGLGSISSTKNEEAGAFKGPLEKLKNLSNTYHKKALSIKNAARKAFAEYERTLNV